MAPKAKKAAPAPPKAAARAKASKAKEAELEGVHGHKKKIRTSPTVRRPKTGDLEAAQISWEERPPGETGLATLPPSSSPTTEPREED
ncbi:60S ribosomal protein L23a [Sciurus carolinensis]|uniref:60S ribosomal protein L23a n=1 Tax=Sciurus carolinensis TaxID=30640 RepID=A0AA41MKB1_SCICA|nr:60S ribosomal protein L23a [Sciurus carolinensis]